MPGITILVIDDDASIHRAVERRLEGVVDQILKAESPTKGLQFAIQEKPDVILLDLNMPQIDGFKVCRHLQEHPTTRDIPILFLTADQTQTILPEHSTLELPTTYRSPSTPSNSKRACGLHCAPNK